MGRRFSVVVWGVVGRRLSRFSVEGGGVVLLLGIGGMGGLALGRDGGRALFLLYHKRRGVGGGKSKFLYFFRKFFLFPGGRCYNRAYTGNMGRIGLFCGEGGDVMDGNGFLGELTGWLVRTGINLLLAGAIFAGGWWLGKLAARLAKNAVKKGRGDPLVAGFVGSLVKAVVVMVGSVSAVAQLQINITSLVAALGAAGLTASFALQGSLSNLVSGMQIIFTKPFKMGDYLAFGNYEGTVKRIEILYTILATFDNKEVIVPNAKITGDVVVNFSTNGTRRLDLSYGVAYAADLQKAKGILAKLAAQDPRVLADPAPVVAVGELKDSSVTLVMKLWCRQEDYWDLYFAMQEAVKLQFDREGVEIPFPQVEVHMGQGPRPGGQ